MPDTENKNKVQCEDEIDLYPYWLAIRKRWKMIFALALIAALGAFAATRYLPKVYRINALISLGRVEIGDTVQPLATLEDINQMISSGNLLKKIVAACKLDVTKVGPALEKDLSAEAKSNSEYVFLKYETAEPDKGIAILNALIREIQDTYNPHMENGRQVKDSEINQLQEDITDIRSQQNKIEVNNKQLTEEIKQKNNLAKAKAQTLESRKASILIQIKDFKSRIQTLEDTKRQLTQMPAVPELSKFSLTEGKSEQTIADKTDSLIATLLIANNLQQNIAVMNLNREKRAEYDIAIRDAHKEIDQLKFDLTMIESLAQESALQMESEISKLQATIQENELEMNKSMPAKIAGINNNIQSLKIKKAMIQGIEVIAQPDYFNIPIQSKREMIVAISTLLALFVGICIAINSNQNFQTKK
jgi:uncharacterized protein involved in exopolysaccharide biosynthesis